MQALIFRHSVPRQIITKLLSFASPQALFGRTAPMQLEEIPDPALPAPDWVVIRTRLCGLCGSDYKQVFLNGQLRQPDDRADLVSAGARARGGGHSRARRRRRSRSAASASAWCSTRGCRARRAASRRCALVRSSGEFAQCANFTRGTLPPGIHHGNSSADATGGFAPLVPAHESQCIPIPDEVSDEAAVLADPFSVSLHAILQAPAAARTARARLRLRHARPVRDRDPARALPAVPVIAVARFPHQHAARARSSARATVLAHEPADAIIASVVAGHRRRAAEAVVRQADAERRRRRGLRHRRLSRARSRSACASRARAAPSWSPASRCRSASSGRRSTSRRSP